MLVLVPVLVLVLVLVLVPNLTVAVVNGQTTTVVANSLATATTVVAGSNSGTIIQNNGNGKLTTIVSTVFEYTTLQATITTLVTDNGSTFQSVIVTEKTSAIAKGVSTYVTSASKNGANANVELVANGSWMMKVVLAGLTGLSLSLFGL
ncbi:unnamed protein product [Ambrosiozyma monospora]|uniref:Unnamed protein product n=1 Tax=Ambrosiozyma monospora TaxID=43982 RepID=A0A9W6WJC9_AMBMO|nr:unnamed protein product [Ambrosiozyma monospora]